MKIVGSVVLVTDATRGVGKVWVRARIARDPKQLERFFGRRFQVMRKTAQPAVAIAAQPLTINPSNIRNSGQSDVNFPLTIYVNAATLQFVS